MADDRQIESAKATARERREARLAAALRANLKRRKAAAKGGANAPDPVAVQGSAPPPSAGASNRR